MRPLNAFFLFLTYGVSGIGIWFFLLKWHWLVKLIYHW